MLHTPRVGPPGRRQPAIAAAGRGLPGAANQELPVRNREGLGGTWRIRHEDARMSMKVW